MNGQMVISAFFHNCIYFQLVGKQEANNILKMNIKSMEKEVMSERTKSESHRKLCSAVNVEFKRKILELEKAVS